MAQQGDVLLFQENDEGNINAVNGVIEMAGGLETAAYLSLFGGNEDDDGRSDNSKKWWGNVEEPNKTRWQTSETQNLVESIPAISSNLRRIEDAAKRDLNWFLTEKVASSITVDASIPYVNVVEISVSIIANGDESNFNFVENWKDTKPFEITDDIPSDVDPKMEPLATELGLIITTESDESILLEW